MAPAVLSTKTASWLWRHSVPFTDVTSGYAVFALLGPRATEILQKTTPTPLDQLGLNSVVVCFKYAFSIGYWTFLSTPCTQLADVGMASGVRILHHQYHGETGWEIHVPAEVRTCDMKCVSF